MAVAPLADPIELMAQHLRTLRAYARRVLIDRGTLEPPEDRDRATRVEEFIAIAKPHNCTEREVVGLLYKGFFK